LLCGCGGVTSQRRRHRPARYGGLPQNLHSITGFRYGTRQQDPSFCPLLVTRPRRRSWPSTWKAPRTWCALLTLPSAGPLTRRRAQGRTCRSSGDSPTSCKPCSNCAWVLGHASRHPVAGQRCGQLRKHAGSLSWLSCNPCMPSWRPFRSSSSVVVSQFDPTCLFPS
jgi:hypothetical protein